METPRYEVAWRGEAVLGECPQWAPAENALYWVDHFGHTFNRFDAGSGTNRAWPMPSAVGSFAFRRSGGFVIAMHDGIWFFDHRTDTLTRWHVPPYDPTWLMFNDGRCDRRGRFWVGTRQLPDAPLPPGSAAMYRLDERGLVKQFDGVTAANGIAWSPDDRVMYMADRANRRIAAYDYDIETGTASNPRTFATVEVEHIPDGATVDADGCYWSAQIGLGALVRYRPDGSMERKIAAPAPMAAMMAFGGPDLGTLYVTSGRYKLAPAQIDAAPLAGSLFRCDMGVKGLPETPYAS